MISIIMNSMQIFGKGVEKYLCHIIAKTDYFCKREKHTGNVKPAIFIKVGCDIQLYTYMYCLYIKHYFFL